MARNDCQQVPFYPFKVTVLLILKNVTHGFPSESGQNKHTKKEFFVVSFATLPTDDLQI